MERGAWSYGAWLGAGGLGGNQAWEVAPGVLCSDGCGASWESKAWCHFSQQTAAQLHEAWQRAQGVRRCVSPKSTIRGEEVEWCKLQHR